MRSSLTRSLPTAITIAIIFGIYLFTRLTALTGLPVFADEAIYIRWAQLAISDWSRYWLFPIADGKTPLFIWLLMLPLQLVSDQLFAARLLSILIGLAQLFAADVLLKKLEVNHAGRLSTALIILVAPFWFFHHRMALMDGLLTLSMTVTLLLTLTYAQAERSTWWKALLLAASIVFGLMVKVPFILSIPGWMLIGICLPSVPRNTAQWINRIQRTTPALVLLTVFLLLFFRIPGIGQLANRGGDFLISVPEFLSGSWLETLPSLPTYIGYFHSYLGWGTLVLAALALVIPGKRKVAWLLFANYVLFCAPIAALGAVVYPRYLFPASLFITVLAAIGTQHLWRLSATPVMTTARRRGFRMLLLLLLIQVTINGLRFVIPSMVDPDRVPFLPSDTTQYLASWSSGHGVAETYQLISQMSVQNPHQQILVATEGRFGTLPDGLLLMNQRSPLQNVWIEGAGFPLETLPVGITTRISRNATVLLVANSDRMTQELKPESLIASFCRPVGTVCLQVWDITEQLNQFHLPNDT